MRFKSLLLWLSGVGLAALAVWLLATPPKAAASCSGGRTIDHLVTIRNNQINPATTIGQLCDQLTITNLDPVGRLIAFGPHESHVPYDGVTERLLEQNQSLTVTMIQAGSFSFHDHLHDSVKGVFTVQP